MAGCRIQVASCFIRAAVSVTLALVLVTNLYTHRAKHGNGFQCTSDLEIRNTAKMIQKGLVLDDTTFGCPSYIPAIWPHTDKAVNALRLFRSTQPDWSLAQISDFAETVRKYAQDNNIMVFVGTEITCDAEADDKDWTNTKTLLKYLGPDHVLGLAVGNELDILHLKKGTAPECIDNLWNGGYLFNTLRSRIAELRDMTGFADVPVTSVFTGGIIWGWPTPLQDKIAKVNTFVTEIMKVERNWVFTLNLYPYFDPSMKMDSDGKSCKHALSRALCFSGEYCALTYNLKQAREKITELTGNANDRLWIGEVGWSSPAASTLDFPMKACDEFSSPSSLKTYYENFLAWDMTIGNTNLVPPEYIFYFSIRDSSNFGNLEYFGLIENASPALAS